MLYVGCIDVRDGLRGQLSLRHHTALQEGLEGEDWALRGGLPKGANSNLFFTSTLPLIANFEYCTACVQYTSPFRSFSLKNQTTLLPFFVQSKEGMTEWIHADKSYAMLDNYNSRIYYDDYVNCETVDIPKNYFPGQYAMPVAKGLPYFQAMWYHMNALKVTWYMVK